jgi:hypothetical protein
MYVFFYDDPAGVPRGATSGNTYDGATQSITFHGTACDEIKGGTVTDIDVVFGCNSPTPK